MQLSSIKEYLEKYQKKLSTEEDKRNALIDIIFDQTGITLEEKLIQVVKGVLKIKASLVVKNELYINKQEILQKLHERGRTDIVDIV